MDTFLIFFFNGVFLEFGDELFCMILAEPIGFGSFQSCHNAAARTIAFGAENRTFLALAGGIMGYAFAPTYYVYISMNGPPKTAGETFKVLFLVEAFEGTASVFGQLATDGNLGTALIPLLFILPIGFAKGVIFAFIFEWQRSELFKFQVVLFLGVAAAIFFYVIGGGDQIDRTSSSGTPSNANSGRSTTATTERRVEPPQVVLRRGVCFTNESSTQVSVRMKFFDPASGTSRWRYLNPGSATGFFVDYPHGSITSTNAVVRFGVPKPGFGPTEMTLSAKSFRGSDSCSHVNSYVFRDHNDGVTLYQETAQPSLRQRSYTRKRASVFKADEVDLYAGSGKLRIFHGPTVDYNIDFVELDARSSRMTVFYSDGSYADLGVKVQCLVYPRFLRGRNIIISRTINREVVEEKTVPFGVSGANFRWPNARNDDQNSRIGVTVKNLLDEDKHRLNWSGSNGILAGSVVSGGLAENSGIMRDDIIVSVNGRVLDTASETQSCIALSPPGTTLNFEIFRNGKILQVPVQL